MSKETLLLSASRQPYRRGGFAIGPKHAPTRIHPDDGLKMAGLLSILRDQVIVISVETTEGEATVTQKLVGEMRRQAIADIEAAIAAEASSLQNADVTQLVEQLLDDSDDTNSEGDGEASSQDASGGVGEAGGDTSPPVDPTAASSAEGSTDTASASQDASVVTPTAGPSAAPAAGKPARKAKPRSAPSKE